MDDWGCVGVDGIVFRARTAANRAQQSLVRKAMVHSLRELFPVVEAVRVRLRPVFGGAWQITFSCSCPSHHADVAARRGARADILVESLVSVTLLRLFDRVIVEYAAARPDLITESWRIHLVMCV